MKRNSGANNNSTPDNENESVIPQIRGGAVVQYFPHSDETPQTIDEETGIVIRGTGGVVYVGYKHTSIDWEVIVNDETVKKSVPKIGLIFAIRMSDKTYKLADVKTNYVVNTGSELYKYLVRLGITPEWIDVEADEDDPFYGSAIANGKVVDAEKVKSDLEALKGMSYMVEIENKKSKGRKYFNEIDLTTCRPFLDKNKVQIIAPKVVEQCDLAAYKIKFD